MIHSVLCFTAEIPEDSGKDLLLTNDFLNSCLSMFSVPRDKNSRGFISKHLNILDPLKEDNNLGRSVSKGKNCLLLRLNRKMPSLFVKSI